LPQVFLGSPFVDQRVRLRYDGRVGYRLTIEPEQATGAWEVTVLVRLNRAEINELFFAGDIMVSWPMEGLILTGDPGLERCSMFVSEMAARAQGLKIRYADRTRAEKAAESVSRRLVESGLEEER
jgi:hypothetical protein